MRNLLGNFVCRKSAISLSSSRSLREEKHVSGRQKHKHTFWNKSFKKLTIFIRLKKTVKQWYCEILLQELFSVLIYFKYNLFLWCQSWIFSIFPSVFSFTWFVRNYSDMTICCSFIISAKLGLVFANYYFCGNHNTFFFHWCDSKSLKRTTMTPLTWLGQKLRQNQRFLCELISEHPRPLGEFHVFVN